MAWYRFAPSTKTATRELCPLPSIARLGAEKYPSPARKRRFPPWGAWVNIRRPFGSRLREDGIATDFELSIDEHADAYSVVAVRGEMDLHTSPKVQGAIERASENNGVSAVVVDMSGVAFMDSTALSALVRSKEALRKRDVSLPLAASSLPRGPPATGTSLSASPPPPTPSPASSP